VTDDPVLRELRQFREDWRDNMAQLRIDIQARVLREVYESERQTMNVRVAAIEKELEDGAKTRDANRRWIVTAIVSPIVMMVFTLAITVMKP
jgi:hypothetical protein